MARRDYTNIMFSHSSCGDVTKYQMITSNILHNAIANYLGLCIRVRVSVEVFSDLGFPNLGACFPSAHGPVNPSSWHCWVHSTDS